MLDSERDVGEGVSGRQTFGWETCCQVSGNNLPLARQGIAHLLRCPDPGTCIAWGFQGTSDGYLRIFRERSWLTAGHLKPEAG